MCNYGKEIYGHRLLVAQRLDRVKSRSAPRRPQTEEDTSESSHHERGEDREEGYFRGDWRQRIDCKRTTATNDHADGATNYGDGRRFDQELQQDLALGGTERFANTDLTRPLSHSNHHDRNNANAADEQRNGRQRDHHHEEDAGDLIERLHHLFLLDDCEVVLR